MANKKESKKSLPGPHRTGGGMSQFFRLISKIILLPLISVGISFLLAEIWLRVAPPEEFERLLGDEKQYQADELLGIALRPNLDAYFLAEGGGTFHVQTNTYGQRELPWKGREGRRVVLGLGDSFLYGASVEREQIMLSRIQNALDGRFPNQFRTVNAGVPGYATNQEIVYYMDRGEKTFDPEIVLVFFYMNDLTTNINKNNPRLYNGVVLSDVAPPPARESEDQGVFRTVKFIQYVKKIYVVREAPLEGEFTNRLPIEAAFFNKAAFQRLQVRIPYFKTMLTILKDYTKKNGAKLMLVYLPSAHEAEDGVGRNNFYKRYDAPVSSWNWDGPNQEIDQAVKGVGIEFVNLVPVFREHWNKTKKSLFLNGTGHFTAEGHAVAAEAVFPALLKMSEKK